MPSQIKTELRPAIFLDRDGTLNEEQGYLYRIEDWRWLPGVPEALASLSAAGYLLVVVSNQAGIARGYYTPEDVDRLHHWVNEQLAAYGTRIDAFYYCPHHPDFGRGHCACRKPSPEMLQRAAEDLHIDLSRSWMIGDKAIDVQAGEAAGCKSLLVLTGYGEPQKHLVPEESWVSDIMGAVQLIC